MGLTYVDVVLRNPKVPSRRIRVPRLMVDTGSELTWVAGKTLEKIGIKAEKQRRFVLADRREIKRAVGFAILELDRYRTVDEVVFGEPEDLFLLGARSLEGFGLSIDPQSHRLKATVTIAAQNQALLRSLRPRSGGSRR
jgi:predicted aspartyl protease